MRILTLTILFVGVSFLGNMLAEKYKEFNQKRIESLNSQKEVNRIILNEPDTIEKYVSNYVPKIITGKNVTKSEFVYSLNQCIDYIYANTPDEKHVPKELVIAQAIIETGWGTSRFAIEANNLFGIRTFNANSEWMLPETWDQNKWIGWGVKIYKNKCDSVKDYIRILDEVYAYADFREAKKNGADVYELADNLKSYASKHNYTEIIKKVIRTSVSQYEL